MSREDVTSSACLILVSTPIGNLDDLSPRVRDTLARVKHVVAEDTRVYTDLMRLVGLSIEGVQMHALHDHNQADLARPLEWLDQGNEVVLVSDAGSPLISDPAYPLVKATLTAGHRLETAPGPSAVLVALELSGLPPHPFSFHGFLPRESGKRKSFFEKASSLGGTQIVFEAPHRILEAVDDMYASLGGETEVAVARELTKKFESVYRFALKDWKEVREEITVKGEFVLLFNSGKTTDSVSDKELVELAEKYLSKPTTKLSAKLVAKILNLDTAEVYERLSKRN